MEVDQIVAKLRENKPVLENKYGVKAQLKAYRQAVLRDAFEGKFSAGWREAHKGEMEPASVLLERIKEERRENARVGATGQSPLRETTDLPQLPEGWVWTRVGDIMRHLTKRLSQPKFPGCRI